MKGLTGVLIGVLVLCSGVCSGIFGILMSFPEGPDPKTGDIVSCAGCAVRPEFLLGIGWLAFMVGLVMIVIYGLKLISKSRHRT